MTLSEHRHLFASWHLTRYDVGQNEVLPASLVTTRELADDLLGGVDVLDVTDSLRSEAG